MSVKNLLDLNGKIALVTGASRGLGLQIAEGLGEMGARVAICARKLGELEGAAAALKAKGIEAVPFVLDLSKPDSVAACAKNVLAHFGRVDVLVNNAGATWGQPAEEYDFGGWQKVLATNLDGNFLLTQAIARDCMIPRRYGRIMFVASVAGVGGVDPRIMETIAYNTSKGGVVNMARSLAAEWGKHDVTVNCICPGFFRTKMADSTIEKAGHLILDRTPLGRFGGEEDLKGLAVLLASDASRHMTGQIIAVDGGMTAY